MLNPKLYYTLMKKLSASVYQANLKQNSPRSTAHICKASPLSRPDRSPASKQNPQNCKGLTLQDPCYTDLIVLPILTSSFGFTQKPLARLARGQKGVRGRQVMGRAGQGTEFASASGSPRKGGWTTLVNGALWW